MKILLADDHALFRDGMSYVLPQLSDSLEMLEADNFQDCMQLARAHPDLDLVLLDLHMPGSEGPKSVSDFHQCFPDIPVVVVSGDESSLRMETVMNNGAKGFVCKSSSAQTMLEALKLVLSGGVYEPPQLSGQRLSTGRRTVRAGTHGLTPRQMQVLQHICDGMSNKEIALHIPLAEGTVRIHVGAVYQLLKVSNRLEAVRAAEHLGLVGVPYG